MPSDKTLSQKGCNPSLDVGYNLQKENLGGCPSYRKYVHILFHLYF